MKINGDLLVGDTGKTLNSLASSPSSSLSFTLLYDGSISGTTNVSGNLSDYKALLLLARDNDNYTLPDTFVYAPQGRNVAITEAEYQYAKMMRLQILKTNDSQFQIKVNANIEYNNKSDKESSGNYIVITKVYGVTW